MRLLLLVALITVAPACTPARRAVPAPHATGPPVVRAGAVLAHARQLDDEVGPRPPGSPEEQAVSVYVTAHLQQAGYTLFLDAVPVRDLVRSTNVIARPPSGGAPETVVVASYSSPPGETGGGAAVGLLLETARALRVAEPEHSVQFVATGADHGGGDAALLGTRRLAQSLREDARGAFVVVLGGVSAGVSCLVLGGDDDALADAVPPTTAVCDGAPDPEAVAAAAAQVFAAAGFESASIGGSPDVSGETLFQLLASR